jgi:hypothetical protein
MLDPVSETTDFGSRFTYPGSLLCNFTYYFAFSNSAFVNYRNYCTLLACFKLVGTFLDLPCMKRTCIVHT